MSLRLFPFSCLIMLWTIQIVLEYICTRSVPFSLVVGRCSPLGSAWFRTLSADMENACEEEAHIPCFVGPLRKAETY